MGYLSEQNVIKANHRYRLKKKRIFFVCLSLVTTVVISITGFKVLYNRYLKVSPSVNNKISGNLIEVKTSVEDNETKLKDQVKLLSNKNNLSVPLYDQIYKNDGVKTAYLTFDDGPTAEVTPEILKILDRYNIKATFFVLGKFAIKNKEILKNLVIDGQAIGSHGYSHEYRKIYASLDNFKQDFEEADIAFKKVLGEEFNTKIYRFPGGSFESKKKPYREFIISKGNHYIDWNALDGDAEGSNLSSEVLFERTKTTVAQKEHVVILMHDSETKKTTVEALPMIIDYLKDEGYIFKTL